MSAKDNWEDILVGMAEDARAEGWTDMEVYLAWQLGKAAFKAAREAGAKFYCDPPEGP